MGINALRQVPGVPNVYFDEAAFLQLMGVEAEEDVSEELNTDVIKGDGTVVKAGAARVIELPTQSVRETAEETEEHGSDEAEIKAAEIVEQPQPVDAEQPKLIEVEQVEAAGVAQPKPVEGEQPKPAAAAESSVEEPTTEALEGAKKEKTYSKIGKLAAKLTNFGGRKVAREQVERTKALLNSDRAGQDVTTGRSADVAFARSTQLKNQEGREVHTSETDAQLFVDNWLNAQNLKIKENTELMEDAAARYKSFMEQAYNETEAHELQQELLNQAKEWKQREQYYSGEVQKLQEEMKRPEGKYSAVEYADGLAATALKTTALPLYIQELKKWDDENEGESLSGAFEQKSNIAKLNELGNFLSNGYEYAHRLNDKILMEYYKTKLDCVRQLQFRQSAEALRELFGEDEVPQETAKQNNISVAGETV